MKLKGKVIEVGNLEDHSGRGMRLEDDGDDFSIVGLTEEECRQAAKWYGEVVEITIVGADETAPCHVCGWKDGYHDKRCSGYLADPETGEPIPTHNALAQGREPHRGEASPGATGSAARRPASADF